MFSLPEASLLPTRTYQFAYATFVVCLVLLLVAIVQAGLISVKVTTKNSNFTNPNMPAWVAGSLTSGSSLRTSSESGNPVYQNFTGTYTPDTPAYWESSKERVDEYESGLSTAKADTFDGSVWGPFERQVYPQLSSQLQARYSNSSLAEKIQILTSAAAQLKIPLPNSPATSGMKGYKSPNSMLSGMSNVDPLAKKLGL